MTLPALESCKVNGQIEDLAVFLSLQGTRNAAGPAWEQEIKADTVQMGQLARRSTSEQSPCGGECFLVFWQWWPSRWLRG
jgi:hypothetical protein